MLSKNQLAVKALYFNITSRTVYGKLSIWLSGQYNFHINCLLGHRGTVRMNSPFMVYPIKPNGVIKHFNKNVKKYRKFEFVSIVSLKPRMVLMKQNL